MMGHPVDLPPVPEGLHNMRWVGEFAPPEQRRLRERTLWRSSALLRDHGELADRLAEFGIASVIDLREQGERDLAPTTARGTLTWRWVPVFDGTLATLRWDTFEDLYLTMVEQHGDRLAEAVTAVAEGLPTPVLVHCTAGKDRTGMVCALIEDVLGVDRASILQDYEQSTNLLGKDYLADLARLAGVAEIPGERAHRSTASPREALSAAFGALDRRGGSLAYLRSHGLTEDALDRLRTLLHEEDTP